MCYCICICYADASVQTFLAQSAAKFLSKELNTSIKIDELAIVFIDRVGLKGVQIEDLDSDTLVNAGIIYVNLRGTDILKGIWKAESIGLDNGHVYLKRSKESGTFNYQYLIDYFKPKEKKKKTDRF